MKTIEYFYSAHSAFAYLGAARLTEICAAHDVRLVHRPFHLSAALAAIGSPSFSGRSAAHVDYFFGREIERWAEWRGVPVIDHRPTYHDNPLELAHGMLIASGEAGPRTDAFARAILTAHWRDDADHADPETLCRLADEAGLDGQALLQDATRPDIRARHEAITDEAIARNVFGSPTYIVAGDMFYGQDRLEMVERALDRPFRPFGWSNPRPSADN